MAMQVFQVPNQRNILGVDIQRTNARVNLSQTYRELDSQVVGSMAFVTGVSNPRMLRNSPVNIARPAMNDEIRGMKIIGGMTCKYGGGNQSLNLLFVVPGGEAPMPGRPANFYVIKTPSNGRWNAPKEFTLTKREQEMVSDILPVFCDPGYDGSRTERLAEVQKKYGIPSRGVRPVAGTDSATLARMGTDLGGKSNVVPDPAPDRRPGVYTATDILYDDEERRDEEEDSPDAERHDEPEEEVYEDYRNESRKSNKKNGKKKNQNREKPEPAKPFDWNHPFGDEEPSQEDFTDRHDAYDGYNDYDGYDDRSPQASEDEYGDAPSDAIDPEIMRDWERQQAKQPSGLKVTLLRMLLILLVVVVLVLVGIVGFFIYKALLPAS